MKSFTLFFLLASHLLHGIQEVSTALILNMENQEVLPEHFRATSDSLHLDSEELAVSAAGLSKLNMSGSGQFSQKALNAILQRLSHPSQLTVIDLREESHGFVNGIAISWFAPRDWANRGKTLLQIMEDETKRLQKLKIEKNVILLRVVSKDKQGGIHTAEEIPVEVQTVATESQIVNNTQASYARVPVADHMRPSDEMVDRFLILVRELPKEGWVHFHCEAGEGRTTTFMVMYDMLHNARNVSLEEIIDRQWLLGGLKLTRLPSIDDWKFELYVERLLFLKKFYQYCRSPEFSQTSWSQFVKTPSRAN